MRLTTFNGPKAILPGFVVLAGRRDEIDMKRPDGDAEPNAP
jgi:hypothetical protein